MLDPDPYWPKMLDPDPYWPKMLDPDPSDTLLSSVIYPHSVHVPGVPSSAEFPSICVLSGSVCYSFQGAIHSSVPFIPD